jgi:hypothetical protein
MIRTLLAGIAGGVAMFVWSSIAHMALPLGEVGVSEIPNESAVLGPMQTSIGARGGLFIFPGFGVSPNASAEQQKAAWANYEEKLKSQPSGILVYNPPGDGGFTVQRLVIEFASETFEAIVLAFILASIALGGFLPRLAIAGGVGAVAVSSTNVSYFAWYGFPLDYTLAYMTTDFIGYLIAGVVILLIVRPPAKTA